MALSVLVEDFSSLVVFGVAREELGPNACSIELLLNLLAMRDG